MDRLKQAIQEKGTFIGGEIVKVDSFLNHQIDPILVQEMGDCFYEYFKNKKITKVVTVESSGIAPALFCAVRFQVPMVFMKKTHPSTMLNPISSEVFSFTKNKSYTICMDADYLCEDDTILFIDDFLANGEAFKGAEKIIKETKAKIAGVGIVIEKSFQKGHDYILNAGYDLHCLASIKHIKDKEVDFI